MRIFNYFNQLKNGIFEGRLARKPHFWTPILAQRHGGHQRNYNRLIRNYDVKFVDSCSQKLNFRGGRGAEHKMATL